MSNFKVGDTVAWASQAAGMWKAKRGQVVAIVAAGDRPPLKGAGRGRDHVSYVVKAGSRRYWPRVSKLTKVIP